MYEILLIAFLVIALAIICLVLVQHGKGADMGASFGAGASATLFGSSGTGNFLTRSTSIFGLLFFVVSLALANLSSLAPSSSSDFSNLEDGMPATEITTPATDATLNSGSTVQPDNSNPTSDIPE